MTFSFELYPGIFGKELRRTRTYKKQTSAGSGIVGKLLSEILFQLLPLGDDDKAILSHASCDVVFYTHLDYVLSLEERLQHVAKGGQVWVIPAAACIFLRSVRSLRCPEGNSLRK